MGPRRIKLLAIEDDPNDIFFIRRSLPEYVDAVYANDGPQGIAFSKEQKFNIVMLDLKLPHMSGFEVLAQLREFNAETPIVMFSSSSQSADQHRAGELGATDYFTKPSSSQEYVEKVRRICEIGSRAAAGLLPDSVGSPPVTSTELANSVITDLSAAFIHKLNSNLTAMNRLAQTIHDLAPQIEGNLGVEIQRSGSELEHELKSVAYLFQRFRNAMGRHPGRLRRIKLRMVLEDVFQQFPPVEKKALDAEVPDEQCQVVGDYELLWHLFENLIRNALEAVRDRDEPRVSVRSHLDVTHVEIVVQDNGPGIPPEAVPTIFAPNFTTKPKGLGVGLYLARRAAEIHGGRVQFSSVPDGGARFTVFLPLHRSD
jgi:signal transduction histidine kinase